LVVSRNIFAPQHEAEVPADEWHARAGLEAEFAVKLPQGSSDLRLENRI
jgi:hypothetical protein